MPGCRDSQAHNADALHAFQRFASKTVPCAACHSEHLVTELCRIGLGFHEYKLATVSITKKGHTSISNAHYVLEPMRRALIVIRSCNTLAGTTRRNAICNPIGEQEANYVPNVPAKPGGIA